MCVKWIIEQEPGAAKIHMADQMEIRESEKFKGLRL